VPNGWVADDNDVSDFARQAFISSNGYDFLGAICPQEVALPRIGGLYDCATSGGAHNAVQIIEYPNLRSRAEFARLINQNQNITIDDLVAFDFEHRRMNIPNPEDASRLSIEAQTDTTVNLIDTTTNQTVQTLPAREVAYGIHATFGDEVFVRYSLLVLADNGNSGYNIRGITEDIIELDEGMPTFVRQAFDSFELLAAANVTGATPTAAPPSPALEEQQQQPSMSPFSQQLQSQQQEGEQPQQQQNQGASVSIVEGSSSLTTNAYAPTQLSDKRPVMLVTSAVL
jgi:hypothetical protein